MPSIRQEEGRVRTRLRLVRSLSDAQSRYELASQDPGQRRRVHSKDQRIDPRQQRGLQLQPAYTPGYPPAAGVDDLSEDGIRGDLASSCNTWQGSPSSTRAAVRHRLQPGVITLQSVIP